MYASMYCSSFVNDTYNRECRRSACVEAISEEEDDDEVRISVRFVACGHFIESDVPKFLAKVNKY